MEHVTSVTTLVWDPYKTFNIELLMFSLKGPVPPTEKEFYAHLSHFTGPMYCTPDYRVFPVTKEQDAQTRELYGKSLIASPRFRAALLEQRCKELGLETPEAELVFSPRDPGPTHIDPKRAISAAAYLSVYHRVNLLCVPNASIERDQYLASPRIAEKLGIPVMPDATKRLFEDSK